MSASLRSLGAAGRWEFEVPGSLGKGLDVAQRYAEGRKGMGLQIVGFQFRRK